MTVLLDFDATQVGPPDDSRKDDPDCLAIDLYSYSFEAPTVFVVNGVNMLPDPYAPTSELAEKVKKEQAHIRRLWGTPGLVLPLPTLASWLPERLRALSRDETLIWELDWMTFCFVFERTGDEVQVTMTDTPEVRTATTSWWTLSEAVSQFAEKAHHAIRAAYPEYVGHQVIRSFLSAPDHRHK
ncbi:hypothetical protein [Deinococcus hopiensis]|uniref:Uncharacterized protein n=1 Tax=Deinococcus hopiensis KR-140 TaxID=695939 RepID=A0A1W1UXY9_9DEIO|nr:hypothetical protein [Deinococcus hopiensis]SMB85975.1 hypothetical protein SAMN00790413_03627 [Deinococcus hopiensis KR-140]